MILGATGAVGRGARVVEEVVDEVVEEELCEWGMFEVKKTGCFRRGGRSMSNLPVPMILRSRPREQHWTRTTSCCSRTGSE